MADERTYPCLPCPALDEPRALKTLISGLARYTAATPLQKTRAYLYRAELEVRLGRREDARASLAAAADQPLTADKRAHLEKDFAYGQPASRQSGRRSITRTDP